MRGSRSRALMTGMILVLLQFLSASVFAWPPTFGMEFNFSSKKLQDALYLRGVKAGFEGRWQDPGPEEQAAVDLFVKEVERVCGGCRIIPRRGKFESTEYAVWFADGWGFVITVDPGVVEIQSMPETSSAVRANLEKYQKYIFDVAQSDHVRLNSDPILSGAELPGHLNVGFLSAFGNDAKEFLRFFLDYAERPSLALGILGKFDINAPTFTSLKKEQKMALAKLVAEVNAGKYSTASEVAKKINSSVYTGTPHFDTLSAALHYQALGLKQMTLGEILFNDLPFEFRAIRQPRRPEEYALLTELVQMRLEYLRTKASEPLVYIPRDTIDFEKSNLGQAAHFYDYVTEMGGDWRKFRSVIPQKLAQLLDKGIIQKAFSENRDLNSSQQHEVWKNMIQRRQKADLIPASPANSICAPLVNPSVKP